LNITLETTYTGNQLLTNCQHKSQSTPETESI